MRWGETAVRRHRLTAALLYLLISLILFGRGIPQDPATIHIGQGEDPGLFMWFLVWWPHALAHHLNPLFTNATWAPHGFNLTWQTCVPLISLLAAPLTLALGPLPTLSILCLLGVALTAWSAFLLCEYFAQSYWPAVMGGVIFGFSPFMLGQLIFAHLHTLYAFPLPLLVYCAALRLNHQLGLMRYVIDTSTLLVVQFLFALELFATQAIFAGMTLALAWLLADPLRRKALGSLMMAIASCYLVATALVSPYIYYFLTSGFQGTPIWPVTKWSADLMNIIIPTPVNLIGRIAWFDHFSIPFNGGNMSESSAYIAAPLFLVAILYFRSHRTCLWVKVLRDMLIIIVVCSLGPVLMIRGKESAVHLPWALMQLPVLNDAEPCRFAQYSSLVFALITSMWLAGSAASPFKRSVAVALVICILPNPSTAIWSSRSAVPDFFTGDMYRHYLAPHETVIILPYGFRGGSMLEEASTRMYFNLAQGAGPSPPDFRFWPFVTAAVDQTFMPHAPDQFKEFLGNHGVRAVLIEDGAMPRWQSLAASLGVTPLKAGGMWLYNAGDD